MRAHSLDIIDDPARARAALQPVRLRLLSLLDQPRSAPQLAKATGMPRQRVLYHLRKLEAQRLVDAQDHGSVGRVLHAARAHIPIGHFHAEAQDSNQGRKQERHHHCNGAALIITQANQIMQDVYKYRSAALISHASDPLLVKGAFAERTPQCWLDLKNDFSDYAKSAAFKRR